MEEKQISLVEASITLGQRQTKHSERRMRGKTAEDQHRQRFLQPMHQTPTCGRSLPEHVLKPVRRFQTPKGQENLHVAGWDTRGKRKREKGIRRGPVPREGALGEQRFPHTRKAPHWQRPEEELPRLGRGCSSWFVEGTLRPDLQVRWCCCPPHPRRQRHSTGEVGLGRSDQGRGLGLPVSRQPEGAGVGGRVIKGDQEEALA